MARPSGQCYPVTTVTTVFFDHTCAGAHANSKSMVATSIDFSLAGNVLNVLIVSQYCSCAIELTCVLHYCRDRPHRINDSGDSSAWILSCPSIF